MFQVCHFTNSIQSRANMILTARLSLFFTGSENSLNLASLLTLIFQVFFLQSLKLWFIASQIKIHLPNYCFVISFQLATFYCALKTVGNQNISKKVVLETLTILKNTHQEPMGLERT